jgi:voltage-gated potassium channel
MKRLWSETLTLLALVFLIAYSYPAFVTPISAETQTLIEIVQWVCWLAFAIDLLVGISISTSKLNYLKRHIFDVAAVLLPFLRPLRLMRVLSFGGLVIQKVAIGRQFAITMKVAIASIFLAYVAAVQVTISERGVEGSNIKNFGDGLWWAVTTAPPATLMPPAM